MMKFIMTIMFMNFMIMLNNWMVMFYCNLCYLFSLIMIFMFMCKDVEWFNITMSLAGNYYSVMLLTLSFWIFGFMFMSLGKYISNVKLMIFVNILLVLAMFFMFIDLILFYLMFEVSLIPTFFLIVYWGMNPECASASYYMMYM